MTSDPQRKAIDLTRLWQEHGPNTYPLDLDALINGIIKSENFRDQLTIRRGIYDSFEGCLVRTAGTRKWTILLNENVENQRRQRFTFAHELGHFMCHRELREAFEDSYETMNDFRDGIEQEANIFASWLLMPSNLIRDEFEHLGWKTDTLCKIGNRFECSLQASALRHVNLSPNPIAFVVSRDGFISWACKSKSAPFMSRFCFGDELPEQSRAMQSYLEKDTCTMPYDVGTVWNDGRPAIESQYFDRSGNGYQYTCIEFIG